MKYRKLALNKNIQSEALCLKFKNYNSTTSRSIKKNVGDKKSQRIMFQKNKLCLPEIK